MIIRPASHAVSTSAITALLAALVGLAAPAHAADRDWDGLVRQHGGRVEGCVASVPGQATAGYVVLLRANNRAADHGHRFGATRLVGGPEGERLSVWRISTGAGEVSSVRRLKISADDWLSVGMAESDGFAAIGGSVDPGEVRRC